jgi:hypothetical protein
MNTQSLTTNDQTLQRICGEFLEMPGLQLTCRQAQRLWGLDEHLCLQLLELLVEAKFLCRRGHDSYARLTDGQVEVPRPRMARAQLDAAAACVLKKGA